MLKLKVLTKQVLVFAALALLIFSGVSSFFPGRAAAATTLSFLDLSSAFATESGNLSAKESAYFSSNVIGFDGQSNMVGIGANCKSGNVTTCSAYYLPIIRQGSQNQKYVLFPVLIDRANDTTPTYTGIYQIESNGPGYIGYIDTGAHDNVKVTVSGDSSNPGIQADLNALSNTKSTGDPVGTGSTKDLSKTTATNKDYVAPPPDVANTDPTKTASCEGSRFSLSWIICPVINLMAKAVDGIYSLFIQPLLVTKPLSLSTTNNPNFAVWSTFRILGDLILVIALLVIVFGQSIGGGLIDAYSVKKILPRLLVAAVLINVSYYVVALAVDVSNVVGGGIQSLILTPFHLAGDEIRVGGASSALGIGAAFGVAGGGIWAAGIAGAAAGTTGTVAAGALLVDMLPMLALFVLLPALLIILAILALVILRQGLILLLVLLSPVAFALYCLPNTEQYFKKWWDLLLKTLLVYPLIAVLFAMGNVFAITITRSGGAGGPLKPILAIIALFVPLFLIPFAFKIAGGILGKVGDVLSAGGKRTTEAVKGNPNDAESLRNRTKQRAAAAGTKAQMGIVGRGRKVGASRSDRLASKILSRAGNVDSRFAKYNEIAAKRREQITGFGNDELVYAGGGYEVKDGESKMDGSVNSSGKSEYFNSKGKEISQEMFQQGKRQYGSSQHEVTQALGYTASKILTDKDATAMAYAFNRNAEQNNWNDDDIKGNWLGATYPHKGQFASIRYSEPKRDATGKVTSADLATDDDAYYTMLKDMHKTRKSFQLNEMRDQDWRTMQLRQQQLETKVLSGTGTADDARNLAMTYEVFDGATQQMRSQGGTVGAGGSNPDDGISAAGATPAAQSVIENAVASRKMKLRDTNQETNEKALVYEHGTSGGGIASTMIAQGIKTTGSDIK